MAASKAKTAGPNTNNGSFLHGFSSEIRTLVRKLEKTLIKCQKKVASVVFNETCIKEYIYIVKLTSIEIIILNTSYSQIIHSIFTYL